MKAHIFGKLHRQGVAKGTGRAYDFWEVHYSAPRRGVTGEAAITKTVDPSLFNFETMIVPADYQVECDDQGNIISLTTLANKV